MKEIVLTTSRNFIAITLVALCLSAHAQEDNGSTNDDMTLGRQYLQCTSYWGLTPPLLKAVGQNVDMVKMKKLRDVNQLAAYALMGEEAAKAENDAEKLKFVQDIKSMGAAKALDKWTEVCSDLLDKTFKSVVTPKIESYVQKKSGAKEQ